MNETLERRPGRPRKNPENVLPFELDAQTSELTEQRAPKKGKPSWKPSNLGDIIGKEHGFRYRRVRKEDDNIAKKLEEKWDFVSKVDSPNTSHAFPTGRPNEGKQLDSVVGGRDWVLMRMPEEIAQERDNYINAKINRSVRALSAQTRSDLGRNVPVHGAITQEHRGIKTVID